jgi:hypothetical protein
MNDVVEIGKLPGLVLGVHQSTVTGHVEYASSPGDKFYL